MLIHPDIPTFGSRCVIRDMMASETSWFNQPVTKKNLQAHGSKMSLVDSVFEFCPSFVIALPFSRLICAIWDCQSRSNKIDSPYSLNTFNGKYRNVSFYDHWWVLNSFQSFGRLNTKIYTDHCNKLIPIQHMKNISNDFDVGPYFFFI